MPNCWAVFWLKFSWKGCQVGKSILMIKDGERLCFQICMSQTEKKVCVVFSVSQPSHTKPFVSADPQLASWSVQGGTRSGNWALATGTESAAELTGEQQQNGKKGPFLPRHWTCCHQRWACLCVCREAPWPLKYFCWGSLGGSVVSPQPHKVGCGSQVSPLH